MFEDTFSKRPRLHASPSPGRKREPQQGSPNTALEYFRLGFLSTEHHLHTLFDRSRVWPDRRILHRNSAQTAGERNLGLTLCCCERGGNSSQYSQLAKFPTGRQSNVRLLRPS